jgi:Glycosyl hydrolases family 32 N-terminal domain
MAKKGIPRREFLASVSAASAGAGFLSGAPRQSRPPSGSSKASAIAVPLHDGVPGVRYRPGTVVQTRYGNVLIGKFEQVLALQGRYLNDHCLIRKGNEWHLFAIVGYQPSAGADERRRQAESEISFAHATSFDLRNWKLHPEVMECSHVWPEVTHVFAPNIIENQGVFYMLYAVSDQQTTQRICLATSRDLFEWRRYAGNPVIVPSMFWSKWPGFGLTAPDSGTYGGCRDPYILKIGSNRFVAYWASRLQEKFGRDMVCIAASVSEDLVHWQEVGPVLSLKAWYQQLTLEAESPCVVFKDGAYWLFFKHGWWTHVVRSDSPYDFQGYHPTRLGYSHASKVFFGEGGWWITHCKTDPDDYSQERSDRLRGLYLGKLDWPEKGFPAFAVS